MVRGAVVPQPPVPLVGFLIRPVVCDAVGQDVPEHTMQSPRAISCCLRHDEILPDHVIAPDSPMPITSRYSIPMPGWGFPTDSRRAPNMSLTDKIKDMVGQAIDKAGPLVAQAIDKASPLVEKAMEKASPYAEQAKEKAGPLIEQAREKAGPLVEQAINKAGPYAEMVAERAGPIVAQAKEKAAPYIEKAVPYAVKGVEAAVSTADKATGGRYHDKIENVSQLVGDALNRNGKVDGNF
jgi:vacuolar-type H+-ATPase subunit H